MRLGRGGARGALGGGRLARGGDGGSGGATGTPSKRVVPTTLLPGYAATSQGAPAQATFRAKASAAGPSVKLG